MGMPIGIDVPDGARVDVEPAFAWLREVDAIFSTYREDSDISRLARGELTVAECRPEVDEVLTRCAALERATGGFFSARPGRPPRPVRPRQGLGRRRRGRAARRRRGRALLPQRRGRRRRPRPPGGRTAAGGSASAIPPTSARSPPCSSVEDLAVATSGQYERGAHIVDPHTGAPPRGLLSVTVVGPDLALADAYATAAFAMGADGPRLDRGPGRLRRDVRHRATTGSSPRRASPGIAPERSALSDRPGSAQGAPAARRQAEPMSTTQKSHRLRRVLAGLTATAAVGALIAGCGSSSNSAASGTTAKAAAATTTVPAGAPAGAKGMPPGLGKVVTGTAAAKAKAAALAKYPGTVERVMQLSDGSYEVHVIRKSGGEVHVKVSKAFAVTGTAQGPPGGGTPPSGSTAPSSGRNS